MRTLTIVAVTAAVLLNAVHPAAAQKKAKVSAWCDQNICVSYCVKRGGVVAGCPRWCQKRISEDARCK